MARFRKKPVVIEAWLWEPGFYPDETAPLWLMSAILGSRIRFKDVDGKKVMLIATLEGVMTADQGDWIIKGVKGELYPCKPDVFALTYERLPDD